MFCGRWPVLKRARSSWKARSHTQCRRFSTTPQCAHTARAAGRAGRRSSTEHEVGFSPGGAAHRPHRADSVAGSRAGQRKTYWTPSASAAAPRDVSDAARNRISWCPRLSRMRRAKRSGPVSASFCGIEWAPASAFRSRSCSDDSSIREALCAGIRLPALVSGLLASLPASRRGSARSEFKFRGTVANKPRPARSIRVAVAAKAYRFRRSPNAPG
jgi:hypothetical protein